jgi:ABC-type dipeptide/oligopeptide/nickel transport system permease component
MVQYLINRFLQSLLVLVGALGFSFVLLRVVPGDPARLMLPEQATQDDLLRMRESLGLNDPLPVQFITFVSDVARGDFGDSYRRSGSALSVTIDYLPATLQLAGAAIFITIVVAVPLGAIAAWWKDSWADNLVSLLALAGQSMPSFWLGIMLILFFGVQLRILPTSGYGDWQHLVLPALTLAASQIALVARLTRSATLDVIHQDYVRTARSKGLNEVRVYNGHVLRNSLIPVITVLGLQIGNLLSGAIITETVFGWPGAGQLLVSSIAFRDYPIVQVMVVLSAVFFVFITLVVDLVYLAIDPRIAYM